MIEDCAELIVQRLQINGGVGLTVFIPMIDHLVLPGYYVLGRDITHLAPAEIRQDFRPEDMLLGVPGILLDTEFHILRVEVEEAAEGHGEIGFDLVQLLPFPELGFAFGSETALLGLFALALKIGIPIDGAPGIGCLILIDCHRLNTFLSFRSGLVIEPLVEILPVYTAGNRNHSLFLQFLVELPDQLVSVGRGYIQLLGYFLNRHETVGFHWTSPPFLVGFNLTKPKHNRLSMSMILNRKVYVKRF